MPAAVRRHSESLCEASGKAVLTAAPLARAWDSGLPGPAVHISDFSSPPAAKQKEPQVSPAFCATQDRARDLCAHRSRVQGCGAGGEGVWRGAEQEQGLGTLWPGGKGYGLETGGSDRRLGKVAERPGVVTPEVEKEFSRRPCCPHHCSENQTGVISLKVPTGPSSA